MTNMGKQKLNLPQGWEIKELGDLCNIQLGKTPQRNTPKYWDVSKATNNVWLSISDLIHGEEISDSKEYVSDLGASLFSTTPKGTLMLSFKLTLGRVSFAGRDLRTNEAIASLINLDNQASSKFLYYYFSYFDWNEATEGDIKVKGRTLNKAKLRNLPIILPPLPEQKRIVLILDKAFVAIDQAKANAEENLQNAKEVFESYLQDVFENRGEDWEEKTLGEVCKVERGSLPRPINKYFTDKPDGVNWIKIGDTKEVDKYIYTTKQKITKDGALRSRFVDIDDFILSNSMSFGKPYIMKTQGYIHDGWFVLRLPKHIDTEFFWYLLASPYTMNQFISLAAGAIVKNISGDLVKKTILLIPPLKEQQTIVEKLNALSIETQNLEAIYKQKLANLEELKKSILQKAFNGELT